MVRQARAVEVMDVWSAGGRHGRGQHTVPRSVNTSTRKRVALKPHRAITASRVAPCRSGLGGTRPAKPRSEPRPPSSSARREVDLSTQLPRRGERTPRVPHRLSYRRPPSAARPQGAGVRRAGPGRSSWSPSGGRFDAVVLRGRGRSAVAAAPSAPARRPRSRAARSTARTTAVLGRLGRAAAGASPKKGLSREPLPVYPQSQ